MFRDRAKLLRLALNSFCNLDSQTFNSQSSISDSREAEIAGIGLHPRYVSIMQEREEGRGGRWGRDKVGGETEGEKGIPAQLPLQHMPGRL